MSDNRGSGNKSTKITRTDSSVGENALMSNKQIEEETRKKYKEMFGKEIELSLKMEASPNEKVAGQNNIGKGKDSDKTKDDNAKDKKKEKTSSGVRRGRGSSAPPSPRTVTVRRFKPKYISPNGKVHMQRITDDLLTLSRTLSLRDPQSEGLRAEIIGVAFGVQLALKVLTDEVEALPSQIDPEVDVNKPGG